MLTAIKNKIIVEPLEEPDKIGSIWVPDQAHARVNQGIVKYIGPDVISVQVGDHVLFSGYTGITMALEGEGKFIILPEDFVVAIIHDNVLEANGLYMKDLDGSYFPCTYEAAITILKKCILESDAFQKQKEFRYTRGNEDA